MQEPPSLIDTVRLTAFRITAYVSAKTLQRDLRAEVDRMAQQPRAKSYFETASVMALFLTFAILAASFGWIGLGLYFLAVLILFY